MKTFVFTAIAAFLFTFVNAQTLTTQQEYNYVTKGYKDDVSKGKNLLEGYRLVLAAENSKLQYGTQWKTVKLFYFKKGTVNKAFMIECKDSKGGEYYLCIPTTGSSEELWNRTFSDLDVAGQQWQLAFSWAFAKVISMKLL